MPRTSRSKFQRRHYQAIAEVLILSVNSQAHLFAELSARELIDRFADLFSRDNPRFDKDRFLSACGLTDLVLRDRMRG